MSNNEALVAYRARKEARARSWARPPKEETKS